MSNRNYIAGRAFEYRVMKKFFQWPYVKRHYGSKGIADIVAVRASNECKECVLSEVAFIQCKYSRNGRADKMLSKVDKKALINYSKDCAAYPIYAYSKNHKVVLINLLNGREFKP